MPQATPTPLGLTSAEAAKILAEHPHRAGPRGSRSFADIVWSNTFTLFNLILIALLIPLAMFGLWGDMLFGGVLVANMAIGIIQETGTAIGEAVDSTTAAAEGPADPPSSAGPDVELLPAPVAVAAVAE